MGKNGAATRARGAAPSLGKPGVWHRVWGRFWAIPVAFVIAAVVVGVVLAQLEETLGVALPYLFQGGPDGARGLLSTIATGMISMTGLVFSITMVVLQLASSQFSPRVLGGFLENRTTQVTLGVFLASFVFALTVTRYVRGDADGGEAFVPQASVTLAFLLVLASVGCFLAFIHHITTTIQLTHTVSRIGQRTIELVDAAYPEQWEDNEISATGPTWSPGPDAARSTVSSGARHGYVVAVDYEVAVRRAREHEAVITVERSIGSFVLEGQDILTVWHADHLDDKARAAIAAVVRLGSERTLRHDVDFGIRQLNDIAERALSPGINDPTSAVECINEIHRILRRLVQRESPSPYIADGDGAVRVVHKPQSFDDMLLMTVREVSHYGAPALRVQPRLLAMVEDLETVAAPAHRRAIQRARELLSEPEDTPA